MQSNSNDTELGKRNRKSTFKEVKAEHRQHVLNAKTNKQPMRRGKERSDMIPFIF